MVEENNKELIPTGREKEIFTFSPFSNFFDFDNYVSSIMEDHNRYHAREFNRMFNSFFKDPYEETIIDNFFSNHDRFPLKSNEFHIMRPHFFPSSFTAPNFFSSLSSVLPSSISRPRFSSLFSGARRGWSNLDIVDKGKKIEVTMKAPGLTKDDIEIDVDNDRLSIKGMRTNEYEESDENKSYYFKGKNMSSFQQSIMLPEDADADNVKAILENGVLKIDIGKLNKSEKKRVDIE